MLGDTIAAIASPPGAGARGVIRVSGPTAFWAVSKLVGVEVVRARAAEECALRVLEQPVEALLLSMPGPGSYTGEDVVELHLPGGPLLLELVLADLRGHGVRDAAPGEFTRRAFEHGRMGLAQAEAVAALISADGEAARRFAADVLRGGLREVVAAVRADLESALATLEAGLDFTAEETGAVTPELWLPALARARARLDELRAEIPAAAPGGELLLLGAANAGKSSLCNALVGREVVLVDAIAGTTRDVVAVRLPDGAVLLDTPGDLEAAPARDRAALALRDLLAQRAGAALLVVDASAPRLPATLDLPIAGTVFTKCELVEVPATLEARAAWLAARGLQALPAPHFFVSSHAGAGLEALRARVAEYKGSGPRPGMGRLAAALADCAAACARAADAATPAEHVGDELIAAELTDALRALEAVDGRSTPEDRLDLIFGAFCLGK